MAVAMAVRQGSGEWLAERTKGIGSSDAPVIAGERGSIIELWALKSGRLEPEPPDPDTARLFEWGHRLEPVVADWYSDSTGRPLRRVNRMLVHPSIPYLRASLDRVSAVKGERRIVEIKTDRWGWSTDEPVPGAVMAQVQHQMFVTGYELADVAVLSGGSEPRIIEVPRDDEYIDNLVWLEAEFWGHVQDGTAPNADGSENTRRALARMHPRDDGTLLPATADLRDLAEQLRTARIAKKEADAYEATLANAIRLIVGDASGVDGVLSLRQSADSTRRNWPAIAAAYRDAIERELRMVERGDMSETALPDFSHLDAIEAIHSETAPGPRVLRLLKEKP